MEEQASYGIPEEDTTLERFIDILAAPRGRRAYEQQHIKRRIEEATELLLSFSEAERRKIYRAVQLWCFIQGDMSLHVFLYGVLGKLWPDMNTLQEVEPMQKRCERCAKLYPAHDLVEKYDFSHDSGEPIIMTVCKPCADVIEAEMKTAQLNPSVV